MIQSKLLLKYPDIEHFFLNGSESQSNAFEPRIKKAYSCGQIHQNRIIVVKRKKHYSEFDGLVSQKKSELVIRTADCLPIFLFAKESKVIAAIHAGWRGLVLDIISIALRKFNSIARSNNNIFVGIGPHIGACCYKIDKSLIDAFSGIAGLSESVFQFRRGKYYLNLSQIAKLQFKNFGIPAANIDDVDVCTLCNKNYFSFRRDKTENRNYNLIRLK